MTPELIIGQYHYRVGDLCWQIFDGHRWLDVGEQDHEMLNHIQQQDEQRDWQHEKYDKMLKLAAEYKDKRDIYKKQVEQRDATIAKLEAENNRLLRDWMQESTGLNAKIAELGSQVEDLAAALQEQSDDD